MFFRLFNTSIQEKGVIITRKIKLIVIIFYAFLIVLKLLDFTLTSYALSNGGIELNPLGFNLFTVLFSVILLVVFGLFILIFNDKYLLKVVLFSVVSLVIFYNVIIIHNIKEVINYTVSIRY